MKKMFWGLTLLLTGALLVQFLIFPHGARATLGQLTNAGFEQAGSTTATAASWQNFGSGYVRTTAAHSGSFGIQLQSNSLSGQAGAYQRVDFQQTTARPVSITAYVKGSSIAMAPGSFYGASLYAEIHLMNGQIVYWNTVPNSGTFDWRWIGFNTSNIYSPTGVPLVTQPIDYIFVVPILNQARGFAFFDDLTIAEQQPIQSAVTIMFDDGESNQFAQGKPVLDQYGLKASVAIISGEVGQSDSMTQTQLQKLQGAGWEIVSHSVTHSDLPTLDPTKITAELAQSKSQLQAMGLTVKNFAMPSGAYNAYVLGEGAKYYRSLRAFEQGSNPQGTFPYDVKVRGVINTTTPTNIQTLLTDAKQNRKWVVLVFHSIIPKGGDQYYTQPAVFASMIATVAKSGVPVVTYDKGLDLFTIHP